MLWKTLDNEISSSLSAVSAAVAEPALCARDIFHPVCTAVLCLCKATLLCWQQRLRLGKPQTSLALSVSLCPQMTEI